MYDDDYDYDGPSCEDDLYAYLRLPEEHDPNEVYYDGEGGTVFWDEIGPETNWPDRD